MNEFMRDDDALGRLDPLAVGRDVGRDAYSFEDGVGVGLGQLSKLHDLLGDAANIETAPLEKSKGVRVAVDGRAVGDLEFVGEFFRAAPAKKFLLDELAVGVFADGAAAFVAADGGWLGCSIHGG